MPVNSLFGTTPDRVTAYYEWWLLVSLSLLTGPSQAYPLVFSLGLAPISIRSIIVLPRAMQVLISKYTDNVALPPSLIQRKFWHVAIFLLTLRVGPTLSSMHSEISLFLSTFNSTRGLALGPGLFAQLSHNILSPLSLIFLINRLYCMEAVLGLQKNLSRKYRGFLCISRTWLPSFSNN